MTKIEKLMAQLQEAIGEALTEAEQRGKADAGRDLMAQIASLSGAVKPKQTRRPRKPRDK